MKKIDIKKSFNDKKFKYGGYATLMTAVVLAILLAVNLIAGKLDLKFDLTKEKMYSLSDQTYKIIDNLQKDVKIYGLYQSGKENKTVTEILDKYQSRSKKITVEYKDPVLYPQFTKKYAKPGENIGEGSLIVESGSKFKVIDSYDLVNYSTDFNTGQSTAQSLAVEQRVTGAIMYVSSDKNPIVYNLTGHNESSLPYEITQQIETQNYTINELNLVSGTAKLEPGNILLVMSPKRDLSQDETQKIKDFLAKGGRGFFMVDLIKEDLPNFTSILNSYGVGLQKAIVVEGDQQRIIQNPIYLLPEMKSHDIMSPLISNKLPVITPASQGIEILKIKKQSLTIEPLLVTSNNSWGKTNLEATTLEKQTGDLQGPFNIAVAITDKIDYNNPDKNPKLLVVATSQFTNSQFVAVSNGANTDFFTNSLNWLQDQKESISISPKSLQSEYLKINTLEQLVFSGIAVIVMPLIVMILGIVTWTRRRHR